MSTNISNQQFTNGVRAKVAHSPFSLRSSEKLCGKSLSPQH
jgi:hypothetical protein